MDGSPSTPYLTYPGLAARGSMAQIQRSGTVYAATAALRQQAARRASTQELKMMTRIERLVKASALLLVVSSGALFGQTFGELTGHGTDATGSAVPGAKVTLTNVATNAVRTAATTESGDYTFPAVAPGFYNIRVEQPSFKTATS